MAKSMVLLLFSLLFVAGGDRYIRWEAGRKLTWDDFSGVVDESSAFKANTKSKISMSWDCNGKVFSFTATSKFDKESSWKKEIRTPELLAHEQLHFDLAELYARKMRKHFALLPNGCALANEEITAQAGKIQNEWGDREDLYDAETDHGKNAPEQIRWESVVKKEMDALAKYAQQ